MDIGHIDALTIADKTADLDILTNRQHLVGGNICHRAVSTGVLAILQRLYIGRILIGNHSGYIFHEALKNLVLRHEVSLGVDLNNHAHAVLGSHGEGHAFRSYFASLLGLCSKSLLTQPLNGLVKIAIGLDQSFFAVHHTYAGHLAQLLYIFCRNRHNKLPPIIVIQ